MKKDQRTNKLWKGNLLNSKKKAKGQWVIGFKRNVMYHSLETVLAR